MANWLSVKLAAEKYGIPEKRIHEWIRLNHLKYSSLDLEPFEDSNPMVDTEQLEKILDFNLIESYPDDETIERVPSKYLSWIQGENERLEKENDELYEEIYSLSQTEERLKKDVKELAFAVNKLIRLNTKLVNNIENELHKKDESIWSHLCSFFK